MATRRKTGSLMSVFGIWPGGAAELDAIEKEISEDRKRFKTHDVSFD